MKNIKKGLIQLPKKISTLLMTFAMVVSYFAPFMQMTVYAEEETRTVISELVATSNISTIPVYGGEIKAPTFNVTAGSPAYFELGMGDWWKYNGSDWERVSSGTFTAGTYRYSIQIRIDGAAGSTHVLSNKPSVTVDEISWELDGTSVIYPTYSYDWATSQEFTIEAGTELIFEDSSSFDIPVNTIGTLIISFSVADYVEGGTSPYTFSKTSGPDWITVSSDGTISGTPTTAGTNSKLVVRVTDSVDDYKEIIINVDGTIKDPKDEVSAVEATSNMSDIAVFDGKIQTPTITITVGSPAQFSTSMGSWYKKNGENWEKASSGTFTAGTYKYKTQIRIDNAAGYTYTFSDDPTVTVDGNSWTVTSRTIYETYSYIWASSKEFTILQPYVVTFNTNEGSIIENQIVESGKKLEKPDDPTKEGHSFLGWYIDEKLTQEFDFDTPITDNITLYAKWDVNIYSVTLNTNGGIINSGNVTNYTYGVGATLPTNVVKDGFVFAGWYENSDFSGSPVTNISKTAFGEKTYYAKWIDKLSVSKSATYNTITLNWNDMKADGYEVKVCDSKYKKCTTKETTKTTYKFTKLKFNTTYYYMVRSYKLVDGKKQYTDTVKISAKTSLTKVVDLTASTNRYNEVKLTWSSVSGAEKYYISRCDSTGKNCKTLGSTTKTYYTDKSSPEGNEVTYKVRAYRAKLYGSYSVLETGKRLNDNVSFTVTNPSYRQNNINIKNKSGVVKYIIYRSTSKTSGYKEIARVSSTGSDITYEDKSLKFGTTYYYKVRVNNGVNTGAYSGLKSSTTKGIAKPSLTSSIDETKLTINIAKVSGATAYEISYSKDNKTWKTLKKTTLLTYTKDFGEGNVYIRVRAYRRVGSKTYYSGWSYLGVQTLVKTPE